jgi:hypothetical protein
VLVPSGTIVEGRDRSLLGAWMLRGGALAAAVRQTVGADPG